MKATVLPAMRKLRASGILSARTILAVVLLSTSCRVVPKAEFQAYREAFSKASDSAKNIYVDFAPVYRDFPRKSASTNAEPTEQQSFLLAELESLRVHIDTPPALSEAQEFVAIRLRALDLVEEYNDALSRLAENKDAPGIAEAFSRMLGAVQNFPWQAFSQSVAKGIAGGAAKAIPYVQAVEPLIQELEKEIVRREFMQAARTGSAIIRERLLPSLLTDANDMYDVRFAAIVTGAYQKEAVRPAAAARRAFISLVNKYPSTTNGSPSDTETHEGLVIRLNTAFASITPANDPLDVNAAWVSRAPEPLTDSQLLQFVVQIEELSTRASELKQSIRDYGELMKTYVALLQITDRALAALQQAASSRRSAAPPIADFFTAAVKIRTLIATKPQ